MLDHSYPPATYPAGTSEIPVKQPPQCDCLSHVISASAIPHIYHLPNEALHRLGTMALTKVLLLSFDLGLEFGTSGLGR